MNEIIQYVYNNKRQPIGVLAATINDKQPKNVIIGWSRCNVAAGDVFDKVLGKRIAIERSRKGSAIKMPVSFLDSGVYSKFVSRADRYFKDCSVLY